MGSRLMTIYLGTDHGGFSIKEFLQADLIKQGYTVEDCGAFTLDPADDYPVFAQAVAKKVLGNPGSFGILLCRSGSGMEIAANRFEGTRAVECRHIDEALTARQHNDANILVMSADGIQQELARDIAQTFLSTPFTQDPRHVRRIHEIESE